MSLFDLTGKVAIITGSSRGIGRSIAEQMGKASSSMAVQQFKDRYHAIQATG